MGLGRQKPIWSQIQVRGVQSNKKGFYRASDIKRYWEIWDCPAQKKKYSWNLLSIYKYWWGQQGRLTQTDPEEVRGKKHKLKYWNTTSKRKIQKEHWLDQWTVRWTEKQRLSSKGSDEQEEGFPAVGQSLVDYPGSSYRDEYCLTLQFTTW